MCINEHDFSSLQVQKAFAMKTNMYDMIFMLSYAQYTSEMHNEAVSSVSVPSACFVSEPT
jgi:hypothetical protein